MRGFANDKYNIRRISIYVYLFIVCAIHKQPRSLSPSSSARFHPAPCPPPKYIYPPVMTNFPRHRKIYWIPFQCSDCMQFRPISVRSHHKNLAHKRWEFHFPCKSAPLSISCQQMYPAPPVMRSTSYHDVQPFTYGSACLRSNIQQHGPTYMQCKHHIVQTHTASVIPIPIPAHSMEYT